MKRKIIILLIVLGLFAVFKSTLANNAKTSPEKPAWWQYQIIDTMKYSRDVAREKIKDQEFVKTIQSQVQQIAHTGATHVAIATPYDEEFIPFLQVWIEAARNNKLNIWFRGNWSGWERWFGYNLITRSEHLVKTREFIERHPDLFVDGDIFSACPECENGGPGDPRRTGDVDGHRKFLIDEYKITQAAFAKIGKKVATNLNSMNGDVARLIMDQDTTRELGGLVVVDHYVASPDKLVADIKEFARLSGGKVVLGEFGAPIPDIHGYMTEEKQSEWIKKSLGELVKTSELIGINYWTSVGSSTELWLASGKPRLAAGILTSFYTPHVVQGEIINEFGQPIIGASLETIHRKSRSDAFGKFTIPVLETDKMLNITGVGFLPQSLPLNPSNSQLKAVLKPEKDSLMYRILKIIFGLFHRP
ncbi:MAG: hypothetical protein AAB874_00405 [Patescibacteria group bacterium]